MSPLLSIRNRCLGTELPYQILGLVLLGTSLDSESPESRDLGSWNPAQLLMPFYEGLSALKDTPDFVIDDAWCGAFAGVGGFGPNITPETVEFWTKIFKDTYKGDEGRKKVRMALICLLERDGLLLRVKDVTCPIHWLQVSLFGNDGDEIHLLI
jgi:hypothetical protein